MPTTTFNPEKDMPDMSGKLILITGGTACLGGETARRLAKQSPAHIYVSGRNTTAADKVIQQIRQAGSKTVVTFLKCDLASLESVKHAAKEILTHESRLDILMCNAGIMAVPPGLTTDGYEIQFGTNHLGHALLVRKLLPLLEATAAAADLRIIILTLMGYKFARGINFDDVRSVQGGTLGSWMRYGRSKLANLLYARELARRYPALKSVSLTPGVVNTGLVENLGLFNRAFVFVTTLGQVQKTEEGAYNQLWAVSAPKNDLQNGQFYEPVGVLSTKLSEAAKDADLARQLWEWTEEAIKAYL